MGWFFGNKKSCKNGKGGKKGYGERYRTHSTFIITGDVTDTTKGASGLNSDFERTALTPVFYFKGHHSLEQVAEVNSATAETRTHFILLPEQALLPRQFSF